MRKQFIIARSLKSLNVAKYFIIISANRKCNSKYPWLELQSHHRKWFLANISKWKIKPQEITASKRSGKNMLDHITNCTEIHPSTAEVKWTQNLLKQRVTIQWCLSQSLIPSRNHKWLMLLIMIKTWREYSRSSFGRKIKKNLRLKMPGWNSWKGKGRSGRMKERRKLLLRKLIRLNDFSLENYILNLLRIIISY